MAKGDSIKVYMRGVEGPLGVTATKSGRKLETEFDKDGNIQWFLIHEKTWTDRLINTTRFAASDILAIVTDVKEVES